MEVNIPVAVLIAPGTPAELLVAFVLGISFGFWLERGGLGDAVKLAGQFYLTDFTVLKVMFTAIVTASLGVFWLARLGVIELVALNLTPTYVLPQLVAGLLFGVGFAAAGLCPGTSCVAAVSGRVDGLLVFAGVALGTLLFGEVFDALRKFHYTTAIGPVTLPGLVGLPLGAGIAAVVALALGAFALVARFGPADGGKSRAAGVLAACAVVLAIAAPIAGDPRLDLEDFTARSTDEPVPGTTWRFVDALDLAEWIAGGERELAVIDLRGRDRFDAYHIPGARHGAGTEATGVGDDSVVILYGASDVAPEDIAIAAGRYAGDRIYVLRDGIRGWGRRVLFPDLHRTRSLDQDAVDAIASLSRYFGGRPRLREEQLGSMPAGFRREGC